MAHTNEWVLWGRKYVTQSIPLMSGTLNDCRHAMSMRKREGGWEDLVIKVRPQKS